MVTDSYDDLDWPELLEVMDEAAYSGPTQISGPKASAAGGDGPNHARSDEPPCGLTSFTDLPADREFLKRVDDNRPLEELIAAANNWNGGKGLFHSWPDKVRGPMAPAYRLYIRLLHGGEAAVKAVLAPEHFPDRERLPSAKNLALIALNLAAKPTDQPERDACSEYALVLEWAVGRQIAPAEFADRVLEAKFKEIKREVRDWRKARTASVAQSVAPVRRDDDEEGNDEHDKASGEDQGADIARVASTSAVPCAPATESAIEADDYQMVISVRRRGEVATIRRPLTPDTCDALFGLMTEDTELGDAMAVIEEMRVALAGSR